MTEIEIQILGGKIFKVVVPEGMSNEQLDQELSKIQSTMPDASPKLPPEISVEERNKEFDGYNQADLLAYTKELGKAPNKAAADAIPRPTGRGRIPKGIRLDRMVQNFEKADPNLNGVRAFRNGISIGTGDEITAALRAGVNKISGDHPGKSTGDLYKHYLKIEQDALDKHRKENPGQAAASEFIGAAPMMAAAAPLRLLRKGSRGLTSGRRFLLRQECFENKSLLFACVFYRHSVTPSQGRLAEIGIVVAGSRSSIARPVTSLTTKEPVPGFQFPQVFPRLLWILRNLSPLISGIASRQVIREYQRSNCRNAI